MTRRNLSAETATALQRHFGPAPFTAEQALAAGSTPGRLAAAVRSGALVRMRRGVYAVRPDADADAALIAAASAALVLPGAAVSHATAALAHGHPVPLGFAAAAHVTQPGARARSVGNVRVHRADLPEGHAVLQGHLLVTSPARTALDIARMATLPQALICIDAILRSRVTDSAPGYLDPRVAVRDPRLRASAREELESVLADMQRWPGISVARRAVSLGDPAAESPLESESRGVFAESLVPLPECGVPVEGADGQVYWADMLWREQRVIGECDGAMKYADPLALYREKLRQEALERAGWRVIRWGYADILRHRGRLLERLGWALGIRQSAH